MSTKSLFRGHRIKFVNNTWVFYDSGESVEKTWKDRPCGYCNNMPTKDDHDHCLGTLPGIMNACCGHGEISDAYVQFLDGSCIGGESAKIILNELKKYNNVN